MFSTAGLKDRERSDVPPAFDHQGGEPYDETFRVASAGADVNLASVDLNLLVALDALLHYRNVTHAGRRVGLSQPAMSRALSRLRALFSDELLVRTPRGLTLTRRAEQLLERLPEALGLIRQLISARSLGIDDGRCELKIAMSEFQSVALLPRLLPPLVRREPSLDVILRTDLSQAMRELEEGTIDLAIGQMNDTRSGFYSRMLYSDRLVCLLRRGHPVLDRAWTTKAILELRHAAIACGDEQDMTGIRDAPMRMKSPQQDPLVIPNLTMVPVMLEQTDLALLLPRQTAQAIANESLVVVELPEDFQPEPLSVSLIWHERCHRDQHHRHIRAEIAAAAARAP